jgi:hypothetical protein
MEQQKSGVGRPKSSKSTKRDRRIAFAVSEAEEQKIRELADYYGFDQLGTFARVLCLGNVKLGGSRSHVMEGASPPPQLSPAMSVPTVPVAPVANTAEEAIEVSTGILPTDNTPLVLVAEAFHGQYFVRDSEGKTVAGGMIDDLTPEIERQYHISEFARERIALWKKRKKVYAAIRAELGIPERLDDGRAFAFDRWDGWDIELKNGTKVHMCNFSAGGDNPKEAEPELWAQVKDKSAFQKLWQAWYDLMWGIDNGDYDADQD